MNYIEILKELDKSLEKHIKEIEKTSFFKRHVVSKNLKNALCHIKRELRKEG